MSEYDERDPARPDASRPAPGEASSQPSSSPEAQDVDPAYADAADVEDTRPIGYDDPSADPYAAHDPSADPYGASAGDAAGAPTAAWVADEPPTQPVEPHGPTSEQLFHGQPADPYAWPTAHYPSQVYGYQQHPQQRSNVPGWLWPVVAGLALMVGLLGGTLGGVAVSRSMEGGPVNVPVISSDNAALPPLAADNGSVAAVAQQLLPSTVQVLARGGSDGQTGGGATGSGFVLDRKGHVITNNHVVADATGPGEVTVVDSEGNTHDASIVGRSSVYDIAVLAVKDPEGLRPAALGSSKAMRVGDTVVAIGSPLGLSSTVTSGIVSALDRPVTTGGANQLNGEQDASYINAVQTDAAINPGNSGGPLVNMRGQVVGVNSAIATTGGAFGGESGNIGVGFAIPMEQVRVTAAQILSTGEARYPVIGANVDTGQSQEGAQVVSVPAGTPADIAGLQKGDVVVAVGDTHVTDGIGLIVAIRSHQPGETITLTVLRGGEKKQLQVKLDAKVG